MGPASRPCPRGEAPGHGEASGLRVHPAQWASEVGALLQPRRSSEDRLACPAEAQAQRVRGWSFGPSMDRAGCILRLEADTCSQFPARNPEELGGRR